MVWLYSFCYVSYWRYSALCMAAAVGGVGDNEEDNECMMVIVLKHFMWQQQWEVLVTMKKTMNA